MKNTRVEYLYRAPSNYKIWQQCIIRGEITPDQERAIIDSLDCKEFFIPEQVGLPAERFGDDDDHCWMELHAFIPTIEDPDTDLTAEQLVTAFLEAKNNWNVLKYGWF